MTNSCTIKTVSIQNSSNSVYALNDSASCPNVTTFNTIYPIVQNLDNNLTGTLVNMQITLTFNLNYINGDILRITFPSFYCLNKTFLRITGDKGINSVLDYNVSLNLVDIKLSFNTFPQNYTVSLNISFLNNVIPGKFSYIYTTYNNLYLGK